MNTLPRSCAWAIAAAIGASSTRRAVQDDVGAVAPVASTFGSGARSGMNDRGRDAEQAGRERHALRVIARAGRHHAAGPLRVGQPGDPHVRAADLERPGALQVLALEVDRAAEPFGQHAGVQHRASREMTPRSSSRAATTSSGCTSGEGRHASSVAPPGELDRSAAATPVTSAGCELVQRPT